MSEWSTSFDSIMTALDTETTNEGLEYGLLHGIVKSWEHENDCLVWITEVPGGNVFGSSVVFVNNKVLTKLGWTFAEWEDGTAPAAVFRVEESTRIQLHLAKKSTLPVLAHVRKKTTPLNQEGDNYILHFHYNLPHALRLTVAIPE